ncbi:hypothetical protein ACJ2A9_16585 [Anaerobacillus sp. MEB173]|uniref:UPF0738 family protein n=1 Tax=Anaerobacillus sp. MEB173 TaxID=3383345 RepID=UPI003F904684
MTTRLEVEKAVLLEDQLQLIITKGENVSAVKDGERMLVDADNVAFIYLLETDHTYIYISIGQTIWLDLKEAMGRELPVNLLVGEMEAISLTHIYQELQYLIENIKGNSNYRDELVLSVEQIF